jgi:hypothetical protein
LYIVGSSVTNVSQKKRKYPNEEEVSVAPDIPDVIDSINLRLESLENKVKELQSEQKTMIKLLEKMYQAQLTILSHQKLVSFF